VNQDRVAGETKPAKSLGSFDVLLLNVAAIISLRLVPLAKVLICWRTA
jgi:hypothetical protein